MPERRMLIELADLRKPVARPHGGSYPRILEAQGNSNGPYLFYNNTVVNNYYECAGTANGGSFASGTQGRNNLYFNSSGGNCGLPSEDYDYSDSSFSETHGQGNAVDSVREPGGQQLSSDRAYQSGDESWARHTTSITTGTLRTTWDRGAYEFGSSGSSGAPPPTRPLPPTNLTAVVH